MEPRDDDINEFLIRKDGNKEDKHSSKFSLLTYEGMRYTKTHIDYTKLDNSRWTKNLCYTDMDKEELTAFFDAFVMTYFPNITKRDKNEFGQEKIVDIYGNTITIYVDDTITIVIDGKAMPEEVEHLYDRLIFEAIEKVHTYGEDMEIGR
jgi:hypothetical protein